MSRFVRTGVVVIIVLVCFAVSIAVAQEPLVSRKCQQVDYQAGIALNACSWKETFLDVSVIIASERENWQWSAEPGLPQIAEDERCIQAWFTAHDAYCTHR